jgi:hypothetical protein
MKAEFTLSCSCERMTYSPKRGITTLALRGYVDEAPLPASGGQTTHHLDDALVTLAAGGSPLVSREDRCERATVRLTAQPRGWRVDVVARLPGLTLGEACTRALAEELTVIVEAIVDDEEGAP